MISSQNNVQKYLTKGHEQVYYETTNDRMTKRPKDYTSNFNQIFILQFHALGAVHK